MTGRPRSDRPVPPDFKRYAATEGDLRLRARYNAGRALILRWRKLTGVYCGAARGPRVTRPVVTRPKPYRSPGHPGYSPRAMDEISWYDGQDDLRSLGLAVENWQD